VEHSYEAIRQWFHRLKYFFQSDCRGRQEVFVDETIIEIDGKEYYLWAAVDCETLEVLSVDISSGRSNLVALLILKAVLNACCGWPGLATDRGSWYDWSLELLDCDYERETRGNRLLIGVWFGPFKHRTRRF